MTWSVIWTPQGDASLMEADWPESGDVSAAVMRFAATGEGDYYTRSTDNLVTGRLRVGRYRVRLTFDKKDRVMYVWRVYRATNLNED